MTMNRLPSFLRPGPPIAQRTGPLSCVSGRQVLFVADAQNLELGARDLGYKLNWRRLQLRLASASGASWFHVVFARREGDASRSAWFTEHGWTPTAKTRRWINRRGVKLPDANADNLLAFQAGVLASRLFAEVAVIGTGDGQLAEDVAEGLRMLDDRCQVATMSLAGSTAVRLDYRRSSLIAANIEIGTDCLVGIHHSSSAL
jgi:hypothetical protein